MEETAPAAVRGHSVVYAPRIQGLLDRKEKVFRIDAVTVGVSDFRLVTDIVAARPVRSTERSVHKPAAGADIHHDSATRTIRALGQDVMARIRTQPPPARGLSGTWPYAPTSYLRRWLFSPGTLERRQSIAMYRRATATLCDGVAALAGNALWLMGPDRNRGDLTAVLWETLRLLPPAWMLYRKGAGAYTALHPEIHAEDDVALFPLLMHRHPDYWSDPLEFRPERWDGIADPERTPGFMPFGFDGARCWAEHLIVPLAERLLTVALDNRLAIRSPRQDAEVPLRSLLAVRFEAQTGA